MRAFLIIVSLSLLPGCSFLKGLATGAVDDAKETFQRIERIEQKQDLLLEHHGIELPEEEDDPEGGEP